MRGVEIILSAVMVISFTWIMIEFIDRLFDILNRSRNGEKEEDKREDIQ